VFHAVDEEGVPTRAIVEAIGRHLDLPVVSIAPDDATEHFGWLGLIWSLDMPTSSASTRARLGWEPTGPKLIADIEAGHSFRIERKPSPVVHARDIRGRAAPA
jgi:hypothetical protein